jgi:hypothetical protein
MKYYKATIKHSDAVIVPRIVSLKFNKIYRIFRKTFFTFRAQRWIRGSVYNFMKRFYQIKILLANMYNNSFFKKILVCCVSFILVKDYNSMEMV